VHAVPWQDCRTYRVHLEIPRITRSIQVDDLLLVREA
jgi:hypothetical protein